MEKYLTKPPDQNRKTNKIKIEEKSTSRSLKRKYKEEYIEFGFVECENDNSLPFCLICSTTLSNEAMAPSKLSRHLTTNHPSLAAKPREYFQAMKSSLKHQSKKMKIFCSVSEEGQEVSFKIAQLLAKRMKPHTEAENIILPSLMITAETMLGHAAIEKIKNIPLSARTMSRRIQMMSDDMKDQIQQHFDAANEIEKLWALQVDESTDISGKAQLIAFARFVKDASIQNHYLFCVELKTTTTGSDIFHAVNENIVSSGLDWNSCISVCTDGAPSMQGHKKGFISHVLNINQNVKIVHCMIHREVLVSKSLPDSLATTMKEVVRIVNYIKSNPLRSRIFASLCEAMDSDFKTLLFHTEVRWLSKGKVLARVIFLRTEIVSFLESEDTDFEFIRDELWWLKVIFLNDLFEKLNNLNLSLQGVKENFITISCKLKAFSEKLFFWIKKLKNRQLEFLPGVEASPNKNQILKEVEETFKNLQSAFIKYFPSLETKECEWVLNPFGSFDNSFLSMAEEESLIELKNDAIHKTLFAEKELSAFWMSLQTEYPLLTKKAIISLLPFGSSYLCELGFSVLTEIKSKKRERLQTLDEEMRVCLSTIDPRIKLICSQMQAQGSH